MGLAIDGNEVHGIARGGQAFLAMQEKNDGSININGQTYVIENKASSMLICDFHSDSGANTYSISIDLNQKLSSDSVLTVKDLIDKGEKIRLILSFYDKSSSSSSSSLSSGIVDLSKPDSNGHFNFQWIDGATSTNTYCCSDSSTFTVYSDAIGAYSSADYDTGHMTILYSDES